ncbi:MAG: efflux RND transporter permease subunit [Xanthomonadales bacterium]|jgi:CzcA family heavy metal efflux pump|nr:efflux RND transporter permease subunit [Xanthomonadales bacterium]
MRTNYRGLTHAAIRRPIGTLAIASVVLVLGLFFTGRLSVDLLPQVVYPLIRVDVSYPGVAPEVIEEQVTRPIERQLASTEGLDVMASEAEEGSTDISLLFRYGTDLDLALQDAARLLERARGQLPADIEPPRLTKFDPGAQSVFEAGFSSSERSAREVRDWLDQRLAPQLQSIPGVSGVLTVGGQQRELEVVVDQQRLSSYGLSLADIATQVAAANQNVAAGNITSTSLDVRARTEGRFRSAADVGQVLLSIPGSEQRIRLEEVAEVRDGFREQRVFVRLNGAQATQLSVFKQPDANTVAVVAELQSRLQSLRDSGFIPADIRFDTTRDGAFFIRGSVESVAAAAILGGVLAMLVVLFFLGSVRGSVVIGLSIPLAILATFALMGASGLSLNVMSLGGLALGVGLLLDNAIVMLENIERHRQQLREDPVEAAHAGADEVISAVTAGTLTNLAAVLPFLFITGVATLVFRELLITISFAVVASLAVALTVVPMLAAQMARLRFRSGFEQSFLFRGFDAGVQVVIRGYRRLLGALLPWRWVVLGAGIATVLATLPLARQLGNEFLPQLDDGSLGVRLALPAGTTPEATDQAVRAVEAALRELPHVQSIFAVAGGAVWGGTLSERAGRGWLSVQLTDASTRPGWSAGRWAREAQQKVMQLDIAGANIRVWPNGIRGLNFAMSGNDLEIKVLGEDLDTLQGLARQIVREMQGVPGLASVELDDADQTPALRIEVDRDRAAALGLDVQQVARTLRQAVSGMVPTRYSTGVNQYDIRIRLPREAVENLDRLGEVIVANGANGPIQARQVASFTLGEGPAEISRENQLRIQRIVGAFNTAEADVGSILAEVQRRLAQIEFPDQYGVALGGQFETLAETEREMNIVIVLALFLVLVVLVVQYEQLTNAVVILTAAPLALGGALLALWLSSTPLSAPVFLGAVLLIGIVVNNAILLVEYIERGRAEGLSMEAAVVEAGAVRLRPILMTTLTTVVGMLPLAIGLDAGGKLMQPLAVAVVGGLLSAMLLTLLLIPCLYAIAQPAAARLQGFLTRRRGSVAVDARGR